MLLREFIKCEAATRLYNELKEFGDIKMSPSAYEKVSKWDVLPFRKMSYLEEGFLDIYNYLISNEVDGEPMIKRFREEIIGVAKWVSQTHMVALEWEPFQVFNIVEWFKMVRLNPGIEGGEYDLMSRIAFGTWKIRIYNNKGEMLYDSYIPSEIFWFKHLINGNFYPDTITLNRVRENYKGRAKEEFEEYFRNYEEAHKPKVYSDYSSSRGDDEYVDEYYDAFGSW
jgi:hypothetical protein